jgi:hypothetical protein
MTENIAARISFTDEEIEQARLESLQDKGSEDEKGVFDPGYTVEDNLPNTFSYHEGFDRAYLAMNLVEAHLLEHTAILLDPEAHKLALEAHTALFNLYQHMGAKHL